MKAQAPVVCNCHFCKIQFDPASPYHKGACYTEPDQLYNVCADCVVSATNHIKNLEILDPSKIDANCVMEQLSLNTGISVSKLTQFAHDEKGD